MSKRTDPQDEPGRPNKRGTERVAEWTIKSRRLTPELRKAIRTASRLAGMRRGDWVADRLWTVVRSELSTGETTPALTMTDVGTQLDAIAGNSRAQIEQIEELARSVRALGDIVARLEARRGQVTTSPSSWIADSLLWWTRFVPGFSRTT